LGSFFLGFRRRHTKYFGGGFYLGWTAMHVLIVSLKGDPHALSVAIALRMRGHHVVLWAGPASIGNFSASAALSRHEFSWTIDGRSYDSDFFDLIWWRRTPGYAMPDYIHPDDRAFVEGENRDFFRGMWGIATPTTRWLHSPEVSARAENKFSQLSCALQVGLPFPETLISNDCSEIYNFIDEMHAKSEKVIYKSFGPAGWKHGDGLKIKYTNTVDREILRNERMVRAVPGIYQRRLSKMFEVRSTFFGETEASIKIDSQRHAAGAEDWRATISPVGLVSRMELPGATKIMCLEMMSKLDIKVACFDFVVDEEGVYNFLELNQQGQFLWIEELVPEMLMLEWFVDFLEEEFDGGIEMNSRVGVDFASISNSQSYAVASGRLAAQGAIVLSELCHARI